MGEAYQGVGEYVEEGYIVGAFFWLVFWGELVFYFLLTGSVCRIDTGFVRYKGVYLRYLYISYSLFLFYFSRR